MSEKIMPVEQCGFVSKCMASPSSYVSYMSGSSYYKPTTKAVAQHALAKLEEARKKDIDTHEANLPAIENNKAIVACVQALMDEIGMPKTWSERDTKSRARYPKSITHDAGWIGDLSRHVKTTDGFEYATTTYERMKRDYDAYLQTAERETEQKLAEQQRQVEAEKEARRANVELARIVLRYELPEESTWDEVLEALRSKDQRLDLAIAMLATRGDWSEGPYRVRDAIDRFTINSDEDKAIANDIIECLRDFEDGRVFRDTTWNYDRIFASVVDHQLQVDTVTAYERSRYAQ